MAQRKTKKLTMKTQPIPKDCHAITPYLTVPDAARLIEFLKKAFDGVERARISRFSTVGAESL